MAWCLFDANYYFIEYNEFEQFIKKPIDLEITKKFICTESIISNTKIIPIIVVGNQGITFCDCIIFQKALHFISDFV